MTFLLFYSFYLLKDMCTNVIGLRVYSSFLISFICLAHLVSYVDMWLHIFGEMKDKEGKWYPKIYSVLSDVAKHDLGVGYVTSVYISHIYFSHSIEKSRRFSCHTDSPKRRFFSLKKYKISSSRKNIKYLEWFGYGRRGKAISRPHWFATSDSILFLIN